MSSHTKEQLIIDWIKKLKIERQSKYLRYRLKYGRYRNQTLHEIFQSKQGICYILWLKKNTLSTYFKQILTMAAIEELNLIV